MRLATAMNILTLILASVYGFEFVTDYPELGDRLIIGVGFGAAMSNLLWTHVIK